MAFLEWKPEFSVNVSAVDDEHREMIEMINEFHELLGSQSDSDFLDNFLGEIFNGISAHFALEECLMQSVGYDEYENHKADHEELLDQIRDLMDCHIEDPAAGSARLRQELGDWFAHHFSTFDARLHKAL